MLFFLFLRFHSSRVLGGPTEAQVSVSLFTPPFQAQSHVFGEVSFEILFFGLCSAESLVADKRLELSADFP